MQKSRPRLQNRSIETYENLLEAATAAFAEHGYRGATLSDIATRAGVTVGAIYSRFSSKDKLLFEAARNCLENMTCPPDRSLLPPDMAVHSMHNFLAPGYETARRLLIELCLASTNSRDLAALTDGFLTTLAKQWATAVPQCNDDPATIKVILILFMGLAHLDTIAVPKVAKADLEAALKRMMTGLFSSSDGKDS